MRFYCSKLINIFGCRFDLSALLKQQKSLHSKGRFYSIIFFCSLTTNKLDDNSNWWEWEWEWEKGGSLAKKKVQIEMIPNGRRLNQFFLGLFSQIYQNNRWTNEWMHNLEWQMDYGSINIDERFSPIVRLNSKKMRMRGRNREKESTFVLFHHLNMHCFTHCVRTVSGSLSLSLSVFIFAHLVSMELWQGTMIYCGPIYNPTIFSLSIHVCMCAMYYFCALSQAFDTALSTSLTSDEL